MSACLRLTGVYAVSVLQCLGEIESWRALRYVSQYWPVLSGHPCWDPGLQSGFLYSGVVRTLKYVQQT